MTTVDDWSYGDGFRLAVELMERHRLLRPRRLANAQLAGLNEVMRMTSGLGEIGEFISRQATRAGRTGRLDVQAFWDDLRQAMEVVTKVASRRSGETPADPDAARQLALLLAREFMQHLITHAYFIADARVAG